LKYYLDEYDFLFFVTDHAVANANAAATFTPVYRPAQAATGDKVTYDYRQLHGTERVMGVIGVTVPMNLRSNMKYRTIGPLISTKA